DAPLDVLPREVGYATDGRTADSGVHPVMVVAMEPVCKRTGSVGLSPVGTDVGPFLEECAVEALNFAVGLGAIRPAVLVDDAGLGQCRVEQPAPVGEVVVAQHALDDDAPRPEPRLGPAPERGGGGTGLVHEHLGVGHAAVVVDGGVEIGV